MEHSDTGAKVRGIIAAGITGTVVDVECRLSNNLPAIVIVGFANRSVSEARERIRGAFATSRIMLPRKRITVNLAPADIPKADSGFDLAIAVSILLAGGQLEGRAVPARSAFIGELGLDGTARPVRGIIGKLLAGRAKKLTTFYVPAANLPQARLVPHVKLIPIENLRQLYIHLSGATPVNVVDTGTGQYEVAGPGRRVARPAARLSEITGQQQAKRALLVAAAGGHNMLLNGPPGTGKTMLAKALPGLLPPPGREEALEITQLHSLAGREYEKLAAERPFRAPHHSASRAAIIGGGRHALPGEISLAHHGILFLDELPEFDRPVLEALRQPLEDRIIRITAGRSSTEYPANFILVATANPCPCGYAGASAINSVSNKSGNSGGRKCTCQPHQVQRYLGRISGPIMDRIDLYASVHEIQYDRLLHRSTANGQADDEIAGKAAAARQTQAARFGRADKLNSGMTNDDIKYRANITTAAKATLNAAGQRLHLSARAYMRTIKVARTIADLDRSKTITSAHLSEALQYRAPSGETIS